MSPALRKLVLTTHIAASVGWIGAVGAYLVLDVSVATSDDIQTLRASYIGMDLIAWRAIVPLALTALVTGLVVSLGTSWGLFRHYWVIVSLVLTVLAVAVLLSETRTIGYHASVAADPATTDEELRRLPSMLVHSIGGLVVLLTVLAINIYKPRGVTPYGWRRQRGGAPPQS